MSAQVLNNSVKREGKCSVRSSKGMPILDETYSFIVVCTSKSEEYTSVLQATGLPQVGLTVSPSGYGVCRAVNAVRREANPLYWDVVCEFSSEVEEGSAGSGQNDPTQDPVLWTPTYETKFERLQEVVTIDKDGTVIANSAGLPFPVGLTIFRSIPVWEFFQIEPPISDTVLIDRNETVNSATFKGLPAKSLHLTVMSSVVGVYYGARRRLTQYAIKYNKRLWTHKRLDVGVAYKSGSTLLPYLDSGTPPRVINGGLDGSGAKVSVGSPPAVLSFDQFSSINFADFLRI